MHCCTCQPRRITRRWTVGRMIGVAIAMNFAFFAFICISTTWLINEKDLSVAATGKATSPFTLISHQLQDRNDQLLTIPTGLNVRDNRMSAIVTTSSANTSVEASKRHGSTMQMNRKPCPASPDGTRNCNCGASQLERGRTSRQTPKTKEEKVPYVRNEPLKNFSGRDALMSITRAGGGGAGGRVRTSSMIGKGIDKNFMITIGGSISKMAETFVTTVKESRRHLLAAAAARTVSIFSMYPVDTIKTRIQMGQPMKLSDGLSLFRGVQGSLLGQVPYGVLTFGSYEMYKKVLFENYGPNSEGRNNVRPIFLYAISAILGDITGSGWLCPSEVVKQQMQGGLYTSTKQAVTNIWQTQGLRGFYQGYFGGLARDVPFRVTQLTSYEITKNVYLRAKRRKSLKTWQASHNKGKAPKMPPYVQDVELTSMEAATCGAIAGSFSAAVTTPLDRIKTLLMTDITLSGSSIFSCASRIMQQEGIRGFTAGMAPRVIYIAPSVMIFFTVYEVVQQKLK